MNFYVISHASKRAELRGWLKAKARLEAVGSRREEVAVKRLHGRGCFTDAAATAPALLGQV